MKIIINYINLKDSLIDKQLLSKKIITFLHKKISQDPKKDIEINIHLVSKEKIQKLNKKYRYINKPTDVLSFPIFDNLTQIRSSIESTIALGDIFICPEIAEIKKPKNYTTKQEISKLTLHGLKHIVGIHHK